jgi:hypothetical protein
MKSADEFWRVIADYNIATITIQVLLTILLIGSILISFFTDKKWIAKELRILFSLLFFFVGICFFLITDQSAMAMIFGPFYIIIGCLFLIELFRTTTTFQKPSLIQYILYALVLSYPLISYLHGHHYPQQVLYILPCPLVSFVLITYGRLQKRNDLLNILLIFWGLTGVKAFIFDVKEDLILLIVGIYGLIEYINYRKKLKTDNSI